RSGGVTMKSRLDRRALKKLQPGKKIAEHGIIAERLAGGDLRYLVNIMVDGRRIHRVIGLDSAGVTLTQCERFIEKVRTNAREGRLSLPKGRKLALTFANAAADYIERLKADGGKNIAIKERQIRMYLSPSLGAMRLDAITDFTIGQYKKRRTDAGAAAGTVN